MAPVSNSLFRKLPSVDELLRDPSVTALAARESASAVTDAARAVLTKLRDDIATGRLNQIEVDTAVSSLATSIEIELRLTLAPSMQPVINATGVILHTNLGRAPLSQSAIEHIGRTASGYSNLEFNLETGERGKRDVHVQRLFTKLLGSLVDAPYQPQTIVVNNCAAAVMLALNSLAEGGEVIVSRGELVEIGGSFRVPDVMAKSGAILREVGTTNRTRIADYGQAINDKTKLLLRVHRSNFAIVGFTEQPTVEEMVALGHKHNIPVLEDLGNGALLDLKSVGVHGESGVAASLRAGIDVITYSGDKLLGGPQAGMLSGRNELIAKMRTNPLFRALRADKLNYAALEATILDYLRGHHDAIPALRMMRLSADQVKQRAEALASGLTSEKALQVNVVKGDSVIGGGTAPSAVLPTYLLAVSYKGLTANALLSRLRENVPPIIARVEDGKVLLDLRTVFPEQDADIVIALKGPCA